MFIEAGLHPAGFLLTDFVFDAADILADFIEFGLQSAGPFFAGAFLELAFNVFGAAHEFFQVHHEFLEAGLAFTFVRAWQFPIAEGAVEVFELGADAAEFGLDFMGFVFAVIGEFVKFLFEFFGQRLEFPAMDQHVFMLCFALAELKLLFLFFDLRAFPFGQFALEALHLLLAFADFGQDPAGFIFAFRGEFAEFGFKAVDLFGEFAQLLFEFVEMAVIFFFRADATVFAVTLIGGALGGGLGEGDGQGQGEGE